jgi:hypothetical protein
MKKAFLALILTFILSVMSGCSKVGELNGVKNISKEDIFNQPEDKYFVYFHKIDCEDCEATDPYVIQYAQIIQEVEGCKNKRPIYAVLLYTKDDERGKAPYIYRKYEGSEGQGTEGTFWVNDVSSWEELYIGSLSALISISKDPVTGVKKARYVSQGYEKVVESLQNQLGKCDV